ncbi:MAG: UDP-N-acetylmuramate--L-alanine ligase [Candidatus Omnitrophota bacterium]
MKHYHFIGIGGIGMSGIARIMLNHGIKVSGSDIKENKIIKELRGSGADVFIGHNALNIKGADTVVYSTAIKQDNPEISQARKLNISLIKRAQALAELMKDKIVITVSGSHGKTTTSSLVSYLLLEAGYSPTAAIGGILRNIDANACPGEGKFFVAEADESDGSFLYYKPKYSIITNIDYEHLDYYKDFSNVIEAFRQFINTADKQGCLFCCADDANLKSLLKSYKHRHVFFGLSRDADIYAENIRINGLISEFDCFYKGEFVDNFTLSVPGVHNVSNALSVIALGIELGIDKQVIKKAFISFKGIGRRIEIKLDCRDYLLIDDYAHHPTEIKATLNAIRNIKAGRIVVVFQPHRYTRTKLLLQEFGRCFDLADYIIITDIYSANEPPLEGVNAELVCEEIKKYSPEKQARFLGKKELIPHILEIAEPNDLIVTLGAGDIVDICNQLVEEFKSKGYIYGTKN